MVYISKINEINFMKELSICMTHYNRKPQLLNTLRSIENQGNSNDLFDIIVVDDVSSDPLTYKDVEEFNLDIKIITIQTNNKWWVNPCVAFNTAFNFIDSKRTIIQNAECLHVTNVIDYVINNLEPNNYVAMSCYGLSRHSSMNINRDTSVGNIDLGDGNWLCHNKNFVGGMNRPFNFCAALYTDDLRKIGGFNSRLSKGVWYDDDVLLISLYNHGIKCRTEDSQLVYHQYHDKVWDSKLHMTDINKQIVDEIYGGTYVQHDFMVKLNEL